MPTRGAGLRPERSLLLLAGAVAATAVAQGVGRFALTPLLPAMRAAAELDAARAGALASANFAGYLAGSLWVALRAQEGRLGATRAGLILVLAGTVAMAFEASFAVWLAARAVAGLGGAMLFLGSLDAYARATQSAADARPFAGVGLGLALTGVAVLPLLPDWRAGWLAAAALALAAAWLILRLPHAGGRTGLTDERAPRRSAAFIRLGLSYAAWGFAFGAATTFFVNVVAAGDARVATFGWIVAGVCAVPSVLLWSIASRRWGMGAALLAANGVHAASVLLLALDPRPLSAAVAGVGFGATFVGVTSLALAQARLLEPQSPRRAVAWMTAVFGIGQVMGPLAIGFAGEAAGSLATGLLGAAAVSALAAALLVPDLRRR
jgi:predicted MFS family arabinose efflux permease